MNHEFCDTCPGCRPALLDARTGKLLPAESPIMIKINQLWDHETTYAERRAFIEVTLQNSRAPEAIQLASNVIRKIEERMKKEADMTH